jgi:acetoin utilization deacetylase AcuC-like enzyme
LNLTVKGFFSISRLIRETADKVCGGKLVLMPGSGYNPKVLPLCWYALVAGVVGLKEINVKDPYNPPEELRFCRKKVESTIGELKSLLKKKWACFR